MQQYAGIYLLQNHSTYFGRPSYVLWTEMAQVKVKQLFFPPPLNFVDTCMTNYVTA